MKFQRNLTKRLSEKTGQIIDEEVSKLIEESYERTKKILIDNKDKLRKLAELLLEKEVIFKADLEKIFGKRAFDEKSRTDQLLDENGVASNSNRKDKIEDWSPEDTAKANGKKSSKKPTEKEEEKEAIKPDSADTDKN